MYKLIIVDDDILIREDIRLMAEWEKYGFEIAGEAGDGKEALDMIDSLKADIVITDIYMPVMDGIELIRIVKERNPDVKFLVISNYGDFDYVKEAMKLGASDYVLKCTMEKENLLVLLQKIKQEILVDSIQKENISHLLELGEKSRRHLAEKFWRNILEGVYNNEILEKEAKELLININNGSFLSVFIEILPNDYAVLPQSFLSDILKDTFLNENDSYVISLSKYQWLHLVNYSGTNFGYLRNYSLLMANEIKTKLEKKQNIQFVIVVGSILPNIRELAKERRNMEKVSWERFYSGSNRIFDIMTFVDFSNLPRNSALEEHKKTILSDFYSLNYESLMKSLRTLFAEIRNSRYHPEQVYDYFIDLFASINIIMKEKGLDFEDISGSNDAPHRVIRNFTFLKNLEDYLVDMVNNIFQYAVQVGNTIKRNETKKAIELINKHYMKDLTLNDVADHVGLSRNYFCRLFKEDTGENYIDYMNRVRIEKAKYFIQNTSMRPNEVAEKVGMGNYRYFYRIFKKVVGTSPYEYKRWQMVKT